MTYTVIYEKGPTSWGAYVPDLPGVISVGQFHLEGMRDEGLEIPPPSSFAGSIEIQRPA